MIRCEKLTLLYAQKTGIEGLSLTIEKGEFVFVVGKSGAGKSTLLKLMAGDLLPTSGAIFFDQQDITQLTRKQMPFFRRTIGTVFQDYLLLPNQTVAENIAFAMHAIEAPRAQIESDVPKAMQLVGLRKKADRYPHELSGGEQFRIALARALVNNPKVLFLDEPTANLDPGLAWDMMQLFREIHRCGTTVIIATHARELVNLMHRRVITLRGGKIVSDQERGRYLD